MMKKDYQRALGATTACVLRGARDVRDSEPLVTEEEEEGNKRIYYGDSWFGSVKAAASLSMAGDHCVMAVKTAHARFPKTYLENKMENFSGGAWIVMEGKTEQERVDLLAIGYKYNKKKVLSFIATKGAGSTLEGKPYVARFPDCFGNVCTRNVARPAIL